MKTTCITSNLQILLLMAIVWSSEELALGPSRTRSAKRPHSKKGYRLAQQIEQLIANDDKRVAAATATAEKSKEMILSSEEIQSISIIAPDLVEVHLKNTTKLTVNPKKLHQRQDQAIWLAIRSKLLVTASEFSSVLDTSYFTSRDTLMEIKLGKKSSFKGNDACTWGLKVEPTAFRQYASATKHDVQETGLHIHPNHRYGASPDGIVVDSKDGTEGLLEIKCFYGKRHKKELKQYDICPSRFYDQIQGQMAVCNKPWCDLMMWIPKNSHKKNYSILRVHRNETYWNERLSPALEVFCQELEGHKNP